MSSRQTEEVTASTVVPARNFDPRNDAQSLKEAFKGIGCDKKTVINILCNRNNSQRLEIASTYKTLYGEDLKKRLKSETSGNLEKLLVALVTPIHDFLAEQLHNAMKGVGTDEAVLIEILTSLSNASKHVVTQRYQTLFGRTLENDIKGDTSGHFRRLCVSLALGNRDEGMHVDKTAASSDAVKLYEAGVAKWGTDETTFQTIMAVKNYEHLRHVFDEYSRLTGHSMEEAISKEFSGSIEKGHKAIVKFAQDKNKFFSELLYKSMKGMGTDDKTLIRIVVSRSEIDLGDIKKAFREMYDDSLEQWIVGDTSGDYKYALLSIVN